MLEAHETLMKWDPRNVPKFKDVVDATVRVGDQPISFAAPG